jgi:hypothetical protein
MPSRHNSSDRQMCCSSKETDNRVSNNEPVGLPHSLSPPSSLLLASSSLSFCSRAVLFSRPLIYGFVSCPACVRDPSEACYTTRSAMAAYSRSLPDLARLISTRTNAIYDAYQNQGIPQPSFALGSSHYEGPYEGTMEEDRTQLLEALDELRSLIVGPAGHIFFMSFKGVRTMCSFLPRPVPQPTVPPPISVHSVSNLTKD